MSQILQQVETLCKSLRLSPLSAEEIQHTLVPGMTPLEILEAFLVLQDKKRMNRASNLRVKQARFPRIKTLEMYDFKQQDGVTAEQMNRLRDFVWLEQAYNVVFLGAPGLGKTHLATGLGYAAADAGYQVAFITLEELVHVLKTHEISKMSRSRLKQLRRAHLVILDEMGFMPISQTEGHLLFSFISSCYEQKSVLITSNKSFEDWSDFLGDPVIATAILDRLIFKCEIFNLTGEGYRIRNRQTILQRNDVISEGR